MAGTQFENIQLGLLLLAGTQYENIQIWLLLLLAGTQFELLQLTGNHLDLLGQLLVSFPIVELVEVVVEINTMIALAIVAVKLLLDWLAIFHTTLGMLLLKISLLYGWHGHSLDLEWRI